MFVVIGAPNIPFLCVYMRTDDGKVCLMKEFHFEVRVVNYITRWLLLKLKMLLVSDLLMCLTGSLNCEIDLIDMLRIRPLRYSQLFCCLNCRCASYCNTFYFDIGGINLKARDNLLPKSNAYGKTLTIQRKLNQQRTNRNLSVRAEYKYEIYSPHYVKDF